MQHDKVTCVLLPLPLPLLLRLHLFLMQSCMVLSLLTTPLGRAWSLREPAAACSWFPSCVCAEPVLPASCSVWERSHPGDLTPGLLDPGAPLHTTHAFVLALAFRVLCRGAPACARLRAS